MKGMRRWLVAVLALVAAAPAGAAEVFILKSSEQPGFRAVVDALRRARPRHPITH